MKQANNIINQIIRSVDKGELRGCIRAIQDSFIHLVSIEDGVKKQSQQAYHDIEDGMGQVQFALAQQPVNQEKVKNALLNLQMTNQKFIDDKYKATLRDDLRPRRTAPRYGRDHRRDRGEQGMSRPVSLGYLTPHDDSIRSGSLVVTPSGGTPQADPEALDNWQYSTNIKLEKSISIDLSAVFDAVQLRPNRDELRAVLVATSSKTGIQRSSYRSR